MADERTEFGFKRIVCDCSACGRFCLVTPGNLVPSDIKRIVYSDNKVSNLTTNFQTRQ